MNTITLVQKVADLSKYLEMSCNGELPLVVRLDDRDETLEKREFAHYPFAGLYYNVYILEDGFTHYFLNEDCLREAIEKSEIFVPKFIDLEGKIRYVDYVSKTDSVDSGGHIVFRNRKRLLRGAQARDSIQNNQSHVEYVQMQFEHSSGFVPMFVCGSYNGAKHEELFSLCSRAVYHSHKREKEIAVQKKIQI